MCDTFTLRSICSDGSETPTTVKRVRVLNNGIALEPDSDDPAYRPLVFDYAEGGDASVSVIEITYRVTVLPGQGRIC